MEIYRRLTQSRYFNPALILIVVILIILGEKYFFDFQKYLKNQEILNNKRPAAAISNLKNGQNVSGKIPVQVNATDKDGVTQIKFYIDQKKVRVDTAAPYCLAGDDGKTCADWDSKVLPNGSHTLLVVAEDKLGAKSRIQVNFTVKN